MKLWIAIGILVCAGMLWGQNSGNKLWIHPEGRQGFQEFYFVQDPETGTRCYVVVSSGSEGGSAISCVPKGAK